MRQILKQAREQAGATQKEIADKLGVSERYYQHIESGTREGKGWLWDELEALFQIPQRQLREDNAQDDYTAPTPRAGADQAEAVQAAKEFKRRNEEVKRWSKRQGIRFLLEGIVARRERRPRRGANERILRSCRSSISTGSRFC